MDIRRNQNERILELGGGACPRVHPKCLGGNDLNVDCRMMQLPDGRQCVDFTADFNKPLPINSEEWDGVLSVFAIEHISYRNVPQFVSEIYRVLKPSGRAIIISPNSEAQMRHILAQPEWGKHEQSMMFGDLDYEENSHKCLFNPRSITKLFTEHGFIVNKVEPFGDKATDMLLEAIRPINSDPSPPYKAPEAPKQPPQAPISTQVTPIPKEIVTESLLKYVTEAKGSIKIESWNSPPKEMDYSDKTSETDKVSDQNEQTGPKKFVEITPTKPTEPLPLNNHTLTSEQRAALFDRHYFDCGTKVGGYPPPGYVDFPCHEITARHVLARSPSSVLELGCGRGYVLKRLQDAGVTAYGYDISKHAFMTRVANGIGIGDLTQVPWLNSERDLCFSIGFLEHIPEQLLTQVFKEMERATNRGLHGVTTQTDGFDRTICTVRPIEWWKERLPKNHEVLDKSELEGGNFPSDALISDGRVKVNVGSFITMMHRNWVNLDTHDLNGFAQANGYRYIRQDMRQGLPFKTGEVDLIFSCHVLEHLSYAEGLAFFRECRRAIKPEGGMRIIVPDAELLITKYAGGDGKYGLANVGSLSEFDEINEGCALAPTAAGKLWSILGAGGHQAFYDYETLENLLHDAGWLCKRSSFRNWAYPQCERIVKETFDIQPEISLIVDAVPNIE